VALLRGALIVVVVVVLALGLTWLLQRRLVYLPDRAPVPPAASVLPGAEDVELTTADGLRLGAWLVRPSAPVLGAARRGIAVLFAPGNGGNRLGRAPLAAVLAGAGFTVLLVDYRGYGGNPGSPSQAGLALDVRAARAFLAGAGFPPGRTIYFGESLGAAVATELSTEFRPGGLVLRSPFTDLADAGRHHYPFLPVRLMLRDRLTVVGHIHDITVPTIVIYGTADTVVPPAQSRIVAQRAGGLVRAVEVPGADHNDEILFTGAPVIDAVVELAERIVGPRTD